ncbi:glucose-induced degradation protein 8 homolog [Varroa jacobsoni]|uniref:CTLH domain-containing protein n=1 Tax=Varroa destructor TaxID=109461 RepID=A0A7M7JQ43_VARDE|nr:glucose-induced degradation protein 8 homolog [Varroa destructor]XP_022693735.1 glucose-induced degradation protein 8 homolog [Varroa jacobsoni]
MSSHSAGHSTKGPKADVPSVKEWREQLSKMEIPRAGATRLIMNYLVTESFKDAAEKLREESGLPLSPGNTDVSASLDERIRIRDAIHGGRILEARRLLDELHPRLLSTDRQLLFRIQQQQLIELIRENRTEEALEFAQQELAPRVEEASAPLGEMERTLALLAFDNPASSPFGELLHVSHRQKVASEVNAAILEMDGAESTIPSLVVAVHMLLWAQKLLDDKKIEYPKMTDIAEATVSMHPPK